MRHVTEYNAKLIEEVLEQHIEEAKKLYSSTHSLRLANKIRLLQMAFEQLQYSKTISNGKTINNKKK